MSSENNPDLLKYALVYQEKGIAVVPVVGKRPVAEWKKYQLRKQTEEEVREIFKNHPNATGIAGVTGKLSGLVVLDIDAKHGRSSEEFKLLPPTACVCSGGGGEHFYFKHPGTDIKNREAVSGVGVDFRADGGVIILPPSMHPSGARYEWLVSIDKVLADIPDWLSKLVTSKSSQKIKKWERGQFGVPEGDRNSTAISMAGKILRETSSDLWESISWKQLQTWNSINKVPLDDSELRSVFENAKKMQLQQSSQHVSGKKQNQAELVTEFFLTELCSELFHDERNEPFTKIDVHGVKQTWHCESNDLKEFLAKSFFEKTTGIVLRPDSTRSVIQVLIGKAKFEGKRYPLHTRIAWHEGAPWYDLVNSDWSAVQITKDGWQVQKELPILFKRFSHQKEQVRPVVGGDVRDVLQFVNIQSKEQEVLFLVYLISCFIPSFPHPMPFFYGPQGSAKSTISKIVRSLVDPSLLEVSQYPNSEEELVQILDHHCVLFFDNVSFIKPEQSDMLCKAITGSAFSKRKLYTDNEDVIYTFKKCIGMNGISLVVTKPDLLERTLLFPLERIDEKDRKTEDNLNNAFAEKRAGILGAIFSAISTSMRIKENVVIENIPRMADFAIWGCAIAEAIGFTRDEFLHAYRNNISQQNKEVIYEDATADAVLHFLEGKDGWGGTATQLLGELASLPHSESRTLPGSPAALSRKLKTLSTNLKVAGISVKNKDGKDRQIIFSKDTENTENGEIDDINF